jgi:hypothetical protein
VVLQPDPENAPGALIEEIGKRSSGRASVRKSAVGSHESNGAVENWIQRCAAQTRIIRLSTEIASSLTSRGIQDTSDEGVHAAASVGNLPRVSSNNDITMWMVRYAAWLMHRFHYKGKLARFGETVLVLIAQCKFKGETEAKTNLATDGRRAFG